MDQVSTAHEALTDGRTRSEISYQLLGVMQARQKVIKRATSEVHRLKEDGA